MPVAQLNGQALLKLDLTIPKWGLWSADALLEGTSAPSVGSVATLTVGTVSRTGSVTRSAAPYGQARVRIVAGRGGLRSRNVEPRDYGQVQLRRIVQDILQGVGEQVCDLSILAGIVVPQWQLVRENGYAALQRAMRLAPDLDVWAECDGRISVRRTAWTTVVGAAFRGIVPQEKMLDLFGDEGDVAPGVTVRTLQGDYDVERVQMTVDPNDGRSALKIRCWYI